MATPSTDVLIGQLVMADVSGTSVSAEVRALIASHHLGGVVLFQKNIEDADSVATLCRGLQQAAAEAGLPPLLIAVDQEGGSVERLPLGLPGAMALGATRSAEDARRAGEITGRALRAAGVNVNFAPVLDVNTNPSNPVIGIRSFGDDPVVVGALGLAYIRGLQAQGVMAAAKHFPGHGDTEVDSHLGLPVVTHSLERLEAVEFAPFRQVSREVAGVMTAHVVFSSLGMTPATLSPALLQGMLRERWGFAGPIFTDSLAMAAIAAHIGAGRAAVMALLAGADVLLALGGPDSLTEVMASVRQAVSDGVLTRARLAQSFHRLERFRLAMRPAGDTGAAPETPGTPGDLDSSRHAREIAARAVTLVRDGAGAVPLRTDRVRVLTLSEAGFAGPTLGQTLRRLRPSVEEVILAPDMPLDLGPPGETAIVVTHSRGRPDPRAVEVVHRAHHTHGDRLIVVAAGTPYDLAAFPQVSTYLATYGREPAMLEAAARMLAGEIPPRGRLPVSIPACHPAGWGVVW